ncbi:sterol desaturase family protein [Undibacterium sp. TS12]|uniref:sterol desaturase family protein n=1 Tax=Undibacterium sp. TS12 TaxID=2908202 RepID=UPI001F4D129A|nr:sterol desaturase family protein [Undibacterium sp. TS12]MCH8619628.1 sterol desaturase family protein [Undibacterium sp. TS12]
MQTLPAKTYTSSPEDGFVRTHFIRFIRFGFYPVSLVLTLTFIYLSTQKLLGNPKQAYAVYLLVLIGSMLFLEWYMPARRDWSMTWRSFLHRDVPMMLVNGVALAGTNFCLTALTQWLGTGAGSTHWLPWWGEACAAILISDFLWYWVHRYSHEGQGRFGQWLWKTHVAHHLPRQVYVFMHVVGHPINGAYVRAILLLPPVFLGFSTEAIFAAATLTGLQGLVSHFNVDVRAGYLNYIFMGTELHRYHHGAALNEGKNYGAVITIWDQLFGSFDYRPDTVPEALGVHEPQAYPESDKVLQVMLIPFK